MVQGMCAHSAQQACSKHPGPACISLRSSSVQPGGSARPAAHRDHRRRHRHRSLPVCATQRQQRDPASYRSMDELRRELEGERKAWPGFGVTGLVNWLRDAANATRAASPLQAAYRALTRGSTSRQSEEGASHQDLDGADLDPVAVQQLQAILMGSRGSIVKLIRRCPRVLEMERKELIVRLVGAKTLFPACDVARMVELAPDAFLQGPWPAKAQQLQEASTLLQQQLQGADLSAMFSEDPMILFEPLDSLTVGLDRLHELWPGLTPQTLANSSPLHLSLAVKALGLQGPPKGF